MSRLAQRGLQSSGVSTSGGSRIALRRRAILALPILFAVLVSRAPAVSRPFAIEDRLALARLSDPRISPGGERVAYVVGETTAQGQRSAVWVVAVSGGAPLQISDVESNARAPRWKPDGSALAYLEEVNGESAIVLWRGDGRAERLVGSESASDFQWLPDGSQIAFLRREPPHAEELERQRQGVDARVLGWRPQHVRLWVLEPGAPPRALSRPDRSVWHFSWSPDGRHLAALASESPIAEGHEYGSELLLIEIESGTHRLLAARTHPQANPSFSADGHLVAYLGPVGSFKERGIPHVVSTEGGPPRALLGDYPGNVWDLAWHPREPRLLVGLGEGPEHYLAAVDVAGTGENVEEVEKLVPMRHSFMPYWDAVWTVSADGGRVAYLGEELDHGREIWVADLDGSSEPRRLTGHSQLPDEVELGEVSAIQWPNPETGQEVEGILIRPPGAVSGRLPLVVWLHGGPSYHWGLGAHTDRWGQLLAGQGYLVLLPNFRGSSGYGMEWLTANVRDWGAAPMSDTMSGVDFLVESGLADPERLFVGGGSYGGYLTFWILAHSDRFRAAAVRAGIADLVTEFALTDEPSFLVGFFGKTPYEDPEIYRESSPLTHAARIKTPLLIVHGEEDLRVPLSQALQLRSAVEHYRAPIEVVVYPREGHSIREHAHQIDVAERSFAWFRRWDRQ